MEVRYLPDEYLEHHGIKGMKWGERNYQYEDGTLTEAGRERYGRGIRRIQRLEQRAAKQNTKAKKYRRKAANLDFKSAKAITQGGSDKYLLKSKKAARKAARLEYSSEKKINKGKKIYQKLDNNFKNADLSSVDQNYVDYGKKYAAKYLK